MGMIEQCLKLPWEGINSIDVVYEVVNSYPC